MKKKRILKDRYGRNRGRYEDAFLPASKGIKQANFAEEFEGTESRKTPEEPARGKFLAGFFCWRLRCGIVLFCDFWGSLTESEMDEPLRTVSRSSKVRIKNPSRNPKALKKTMMNLFRPLAHESSTRAEFSIAAPKA